jgi:hypothetical protein
VISSGLADLAYSQAWSWTRQETFRKGNPRKARPMTRCRIERTRRSSRLAIHSRKPRRDRIQHRASVASSRHDSPVYHATHSCSPLPAGHITPPCTDTAHTVLPIALPRPISSQRVNRQRSDGTPRVSCSVEEPRHTLRLRRPRCPGADRPPRPPVDTSTSTPTADAG